MANQIQILRLVVASPGDVQAERNVLATVVEELNRGAAADRNLHLEIDRWETDTFPGFHPEGPQGLIDHILKIQECDVLITIFWKRFGTPIKNASSGTEHEFYLAYEAWKRKGRPQIMLYFKQKPYTPQTRDETDQWGQVLEFKKKVPAEGLWWPFKTTVEFERLVRNHLVQFLRNYIPQELEISSDLRICILGTESHNYSRAIILNFCIINDSQRHKTLTDLSIEILKADPLSTFSVKTIGAPFTPRKYYVTLDPMRAKISITDQRFMYAPNERDDFQLELSSEPGWKYEIRVLAQNRDILRDYIGQVQSESVTLEFPGSMGR